MWSGLSHVNSDNEGCCYIKGLRVSDTNRTGTTMGVVNTWPHDNVFVNVKVYHLLYLCIQIIQSFCCL